MSCPAASGRVQCPLKTSSLGRDPRLPLAGPEPSPAGPAKICSQQSITIPPEAGAQHYQVFPYGSADWQRVYFRPQQRRRFQRLRQGPPPRGHRAARHPPHPRHRRPRSCWPSNSPTPTAARPTAGCPPSRPTGTHPADAPPATDRPNRSAAGAPQATSPLSERDLTPTGKSHRRQPQRPYGSGPTKRAPAPPNHLSTTAAHQNGPHRDHDEDRFVTAQQHLTSVLRCARGGI
jgi:hypothetical protein